MSGAIKACIVRHVLALFAAALLALPAGTADAFHRNDSVAVVAGEADAGQISDATPALMQGISIAAIAILPDLVHLDSPAGDPRDTGVVAQAYECQADDLDLDLLDAMLAPELRLGWHAGWTLPASIRLARPIVFEVSEDRVHVPRG